jgi:hypothetical protein
MDFVNMARTARENLARGLNALQSPGVPPSLMSVAEPIAQAMGCMHRIETSGGAETNQVAPTALAHVRKALSDLQAQPVPHPAVDQALEAVAGSLGLIHQLSQAIPPATQPSNAYHFGGREPTPQVAVVAPPTPAAAWPQPTPAPVQQPQWQQPAPPTQPAPAHWGQQPLAPAPQPQWQQPAPQPQWQQPAPQPTPAPVQPAWQQPAPQPQWQAPPPPPPAPAPAPAPAAAHWGQQTVPAGTDPNKVLRFDAELGAHSATNFYKGLSGNDVIDSGGIFIATYQIPEIGKNVQLKVSLPGGYEFEAVGVVRWTRDAPQSGADSAPGFGVQFTHITPEGRQLVYRYVRNREPIFHDDL